MARVIPLLCQRALRSGCVASSEVAHELLLPAVPQASAHHDYSTCKSSAVVAACQDPNLTCGQSLQPALMATPRPTTCVGGSSYRLYSTGTVRSSSLFAPDYAIGLHNIRDNPGANKKAIRLGRGDSGRRGNYSGRGMKGQKARNSAHTLYDGGQLGLIKFPVTRERPPYQALYSQLGLARLIEYIQVGRLSNQEVITMKDLQDCECVNDIQYGVLLYGWERLTFPIHIQVTACDDNTRAVIEAAGGSVTRVYYTAEGLKALLDPTKYTRLGLPLPQPPPAWHPRHDGRFDVIGQMRPNKKLPGSSADIA